MKKLMMVAAIAVAVSGTSSVWADDYHGDQGQGGGYDRHDDQGQGGGYDHHGDRGDRGDHGQAGDQRGGEGHGRWADDNGPHNFPAPAPYHRPRGFQPGHQWQAGERLPASHRSSRYYVTDYQRYNLQAPPPGHRWVRVDNDFVLTAIATGVVVDVLHNVLQ